LSVLRSEVGKTWGTVLISSDIAADRRKISWVCNRAESSRSAGLLILVRGDHGCSRR
jgi:hypothetical protein